MTDRHPVIPPGHESTYARFGFAPAFRAGNTVYVSGVIGRGADGKVPADEAAEYASVFESLAVVLGHRGVCRARRRASQRGGHPFGHHAGRAR